LFNRRRCVNNSLAWSSSCSLIAAIPFMAYILRT
jgi:hypothetical protein